MIKHGWLLRDDKQSWRVGGVDIDPATKTRREEYNWVLDHIGRGCYQVLDAAAGYVPTWHELPKMLAMQGYDVTAIDIDRRSLDMPPEQNVLRMLGDITNLPFANQSFDIVCCISVLEHLAPTQVVKAANELIRVAKKQVLITADNGGWLPELFGCEEHIRNVPEEPTLNPPVYFLEINL